MRPPEAKTPHFGIIGPKMTEELELPIERELTLIAKSMVSYREVNIE